jgi:hypothetical protein
MTWIVIVNCGSEKKAETVATNLRSKGVPARALNYVAGELVVPK